MKKKKIIVGVSLAVILVLVLALLLVFGFSRNDKESASSPVKEAQYFEENVVSGGDYEVLSEISLETCAAVYKGNTVLKPVCEATYGADKETVSLDDDMLVLDKLGEYQLTFRFLLPDGEEKTVERTINSVDTTAPTIVDRFKNRYRYGSTVDLSKSMLIVDAFDDSPTTDIQVYAGEVKEENKVAISGQKFVIKKQADHNVVVTSVDAYGNKNEKQMHLYVIGVNELEYFDVPALFDGACTTIGGAKLTHNTDAKYIKEGSGSVQYKQGGTWTAFGFPACEELDWTDYYGLSFWVFNASTHYDASISVSSRTSLNGSVTENNSSAQKISFNLKKNDWTECVLNKEQVRELFTAEHPYVTINVNYEANGGKKDDARWTDIELYFDQFTLRTKPSFTITEGEIADKYYYGDVVKVPSFVMNLKDGSSGVGSVKVYVDDAEVPVENGCFTIRSYEDYRYEVTTTIGGKIYTDSYTFSVYDELDSICDWTELLAGSMVEISKETINIENTKKTAIKWKAKQNYNYPNGVFKDSNEVPWKDNKLAFKVYNPTKHDYRFTLYATTHETAMSSATKFTAGSKVIKDVVVKAGEIKAVAVYGKEFDYRAYPGLAISMNVYRNGAYTDGTLKATAQFAACELYFYDFELSKEDAPSKEGDDYWIVAANRESNTHMSTDMVKEGNYTVWWGPNGNYPNIEFSKTVNWSRVSTFSFQIYNPSNRNIKVDAKIGATVAAENVVLKAGKWTTVTIKDCSKFVDGATLKVSVDYTQNGGATSMQWRSLLNNGLYFDCFKVNYKE